MRSPLLAGLFALALLGGCDDCPVPGCDDGITFNLSLDPETSFEAVELEMTVCRNEICVTGAGGGPGNQFVFPANAEIGLASELGSDSVTGFIRVDGAVSRSTDEYAVTLVHVPTQRVIAHIAQTVQLEVSAPPEDACAGTCRQAFIDGELWR